MPSNPKLRIFDLEVHEEGKEPYIVTMDQRDQAEFELQEFGTSYHLVAGVYATFLRWTAWHSLTRQNLTKLPWETWKKKVIYVRDAEAPSAPAAAEVDDDTPLDAGR